MDHPSRRPAPLAPAAAAANHPNYPESAFLAPHPAIVDGIIRRIWSPRYGYGTLIDVIGHPPAIAHVAHYPDRPEPIVTQHAAAFFVLN